MKRALTDVMEPNTEERRRHARRQLQQRRLAPKEDADTYVYQLERLLDRACPGLSKEVRERELLDRFVDGLPAAIREKLLLVPHLSGLWKSDSKLRRFCTIWSQLKLEDGVLYRVRRPHGLSTDKMLLVLPQSLVQESLTAIHDSLGHFGTDKTIAMAEERFWWPGYVSDIQTWVKTCATCAQSKPPHRNLRAPMEPIQVGGPIGDDRD